MFLSIVIEGDALGSVSGGQQKRFMFHGNSITPGRDPLVTLSAGSSSPFHYSSLHLVGDAKRAVFGPVRCQGEGRTASREAPFPSSIGGAGGVALPFRRSVSSMEFSLCVREDEAE
jgi:hypothetical protein|uniref:Uncharacterized protein n=1 Tax=Leptospirillum ferrodiazotrophum TaxID=412449 RepID=C6HYS3_9BACT|nr:MAG: hypothetical protein UBAL3_94240154 [Leptospirillum ferrodiazotrophum]